jgi:hypothetical protein
LICNDGQPHFCGKCDSYVEAAPTVAQAPRAGVVDNTCIRCDNKDMDNCFACGKPLTSTKRLVDTRDDQRVYVGPDCFAKVVKAAEVGYQPPKGGPRLWVL